MEEFKEIYSNITFAYKSNEITAKISKDIIKIHRLDFQNYKMQNGILDERQYQWVRINFLDIVEKTIKEKIKIMKRISNQYTH